MDSSLNSSENLSYFIDEAGDTTLFDRRGRKLLVGETASSYFMLGKIRVDLPDKLRADLNQLRTELVADPYFRDVPSMQLSAGKTAVMFHAKDDRPEVRREVFQLLLKHEIRFYAVVRNKLDLANFVRMQSEQDPNYRFRELELYQTLTRELFQRLRPFADVVNLVFASRGNITRNDALRESLAAADNHFAATFGFERKRILNVTAVGSRREPCLQACDYFLWALQRHFEQGESGFIEMLWDKIGEIVDLDLENNGRRGMHYTQENPIFAARPPDGA